MKPARGSDSDASTSASDEDDDEGGSGDEARRGGGGDAFSGPAAGRGMTSKVKAAALELLEGGLGGRATSIPLLLGTRLAAWGGSDVD